ncbi:MAG: transglycosylase SLT domain-containing protein [Clostridia bacterium]|nr:transglycosylase SLT domain-containing protein [Clostridia bacterium]
MKLTAQRLLIFLGILLLSIGFGLGFDAVATAVEKNSHPRPEALTASIAANAKEFGVPEPILWATVKEQSDFASNAADALGHIGLMQLTAAQYESICTTLLNEVPLDAGMLYDPATNLRCGAAYLSWLYQRYGVWDTVFAAYHAGVEQVDAWLGDPDHVDELGRLTKLPSATANYVERMNKTVTLYSKLYYES